MLGIRTLVRSGRGDGRPDRRRAAALLSAAGAVAVYVWGALLLSVAVLTADDSGTDAFPIRPCREGGIERAEKVVDYRVSYLPLRFTCVRSTGGGYTVAVPGYVNPTAGVLALTAATCAVSAAAAVRRTARAQSPARTP
ncbi:hypothetical protein ASE03_32360 [Kitasatospora sp. Root187]|nr:hypothetical protein ASC99_29430 [Kitasatospora sp. Root107]KRB65127.1 hypothetical protein ASE03_32360 [Kitasatospora sp. Root187]